MSMHSTSLTFWRRTSESGVAPVTDPWQRRERKRPPFAAHPNAAFCRSSQRPFPAFSALQFLMDIWCTNADSFAGAYDVKVSSIAMIKVRRLHRAARHRLPPLRSDAHSARPFQILLTGDPRLNFEVKGDLIQEKGIRTRAKSKKGGL